MKSDFQMSFTFQGVWNEGRFCEDSYWFVSFRIMFIVFEAYLIAILVELGPSGVADGST